MSDPATFRIEVLLSVQRALWDMVTPALRAIAVRPRYPLIEARLLYETVGEEQRQLALELEAYVVADFLPPVGVRFEAVEIPETVQRELETGEEWVYRRREGEPS
jgi:hypothetical protein